MSKPNEYIRCPKCELNYILKKDKICKVCKDELDRIGKREDEDELIVCPVCKINFINPDEDMCEACLEEKDLEDTEEVSTEKSENWRMYVENDDTETEEDELGEMTSIVDEDDELLSGTEEFDDEEIEDLDEEFEDIDDEEDFEEDEDLSLLEDDDDDNDIDEEDSEDEEEDY